MAKCAQLKKFEAQSKIYTNIWNKESKTGAAKSAPPEKPPASNYTLYVETDEFLGEVPSVSKYINCSIYPELKELTEVMEGLKIYHAKSRGVTWTHRKKHEFTLTMGSGQPIRDDVAQAIMRLGNGVVCKNTKTLVTCNFGILSVGSGERFKALKSVWDTVNAGIEQGKLKAKTACVEKGTAHEAPPAGRSQEGKGAI